MNIQKILVPTDFSAASRAAVEPARALAKKFGVQLDLLHVCDDHPALPTSGVMMTPSGNFTVADLMLRGAGRQMEALMMEVRGGGVRAQGRILTGGPWRTIVDVLEREHYDLAVVSTHGRRGVDRMLVGSVTEKLIRHSPCPVLVIHSTTKA